MRDVSTHDARASAFALVVVATSIASAACGSSHGASSDAGSQSDGAPWDGGECFGSACVRPKTIPCRPGGPPAAFVSQSVPSTVAAYDPKLVGLTFANCSESTWLAGKTTLGPVEESFVWGEWRRIVVTSEVPVGSEVTIAFPLEPMPLLGAQSFSWQLTVERPDETTAIAAPSTAVDVQIVAPNLPTPTAVCPKAQADPLGNEDASGALQTCIDATPPGGTLSLPAGIFRVDRQLHVGKPITIETAGYLHPPCFSQGEKCAVLRAGPSFSARDGILVATGDHVVIRRVVFDGARDTRLDSDAANQCRAGASAFGANVSFLGCTRCAFQYAASVRALCGPSLFVRGDDVDVDNNVFYENGGNDEAGMASSGIVVDESARGALSANVVRDATEVGIWLGGLPDGSFVGNTVWQVRRAIYAAYMLDDMNDRTSGDFRGARITDNNASCGSNQCDYGYQLGPHAFYATKRNTLGGLVTSNNAGGAKMNVDVFGAGTTDAPIAVFGNNIGGAPASATFACGKDHAGSDFNIAADSVVDRKGETTTTTTFGDFTCR